MPAKTATQRAEVLRKQLLVLNEEAHRESHELQKAFIQQLIDLAPGDGLAWGEPPLVDIFLDDDSVLRRARVYGYHHGFHANRPFYLNVHVSGGIKNSFELSLYNVKDIKVSPNQDQR